MDNRLVRQRRDFIRDNHPDRGGDPNVFIAGLAAFDGGQRPTTTGQSSGPPSRIRVVAVAKVPLRTRLLRVFHLRRRASPPRKTGGRPSDLGRVS